MPDKSIRDQIVNLQNKLNPEDFYVFERVENSILDNESDPNPDLASEDRDHWLINQTWIAALTTVVDILDEHRASTSSRGAGDGRAGA